MNKRQKQVQAQFLSDEEAVIRKLKNQYHHSLKDIEKKAKALQDDIDRLGKLANLSVSDEEKAQFLSMQQSKVYQKQYQDALKTQINSILENMQVEEFRTISEYLQTCYENGFVGTMFDLHGQGIPLCFPMDQEAMVRAIQLDSKISKGLYSRLGEDVAILKKKIASQISRGIATGMTWAQTAKQLEGITNIGFNNAVRIARTEGHRIQVQSGMDACHKAKEKGADVVKQWDSTLDGATRPSHQAVDGEIRELDEPFSNGLMFPGDPSGGASEVVNCRCALLQRARWALDEDELETLKERAEYFGLDKADTFDDFKTKYLKAAETSGQKPETKFASFKLSGIDADYAPDIEATFNGLMSDYPIEGLAVKTNRAVSEFGHFNGQIKGTTKNGNSCAVWNNEICISKTNCKDRATSSELHLANYEDRMSALVKADRLDLATIPHEYAHALDCAYTLAKNPDLKAFADKYKTAQKLTRSDITKINDFNNALWKSDSRLSKEIFDELRKEYELDYTGAIMRIGSEYGSYAASSISEFLAEAFANMRMLDDKDKTDFMKSFERIFNRKFNEVMGG